MRSPQELRARNAAGKQAHSSPKSAYMRPHRVHTEAEEKAAFERHHKAELEEEAFRHRTHLTDADIAREAQEEQQDQRIKGINFDDERKKRGRRQENEEERDEDGEAAAQAAQAAAAKGLAQVDDKGRYFQDAPEDRMGDPNLVDPNTMKRILGPSVRFAQHAMLMAEAKLKEGLPREETLQYLSRFYLDCGDRAYAQKALREFGPATGIVDIYPLELIDHLLQHVPSFCNKIKRGRFCTSTVGLAYRAKAGEPITLRYDPLLRIRGFALKGGARPGYLLEPIDPPGTYQLTFSEAGDYDVLISAISKDGWLLVEELRCEIAPGDPQALNDKNIMKKAREDAAEDPEKPPEPGKTDTPAEVEAKAEEKKKNLTIHFPRRI